jgi:hypothetical protein
VRRFLPTLAGATAAFTLVLAVGGAGGGGLGYPVLVVGLGVGGLVSRRRAGGETGWGPDETFAFRPAAARTAGGPVAVISALGRVEARELGASASFGVGLGFAGLVVVLFGFTWSDDFGGDVPRYTQMLGIMVHPLVGLTVLGAFRARTRGWREGVEELFATCPASEATRTAGHLATAWLPAAAALATALVLLFAITSRSPLVFGDVGLRQVADVVVVVVLAVGGVALGVLLARLLPWTLVPVIAVIAIGFGSARLATNGRSSNAVRQLSTWLGDPELDPRFTAPHWAARLVWLVALVAIVVALVALREVRRPATAVALGSSVLLALASLWAVTRPISDAAAERIAAMVADPRGTQDCRAVGSVTVCAFEAEHALRDLYVDEVAPVVAAAPADFGPVVIRYAADLDRIELDPKVLALLPAAEAEPGLVPVEMIAVDQALQGARIWVGLAAAGVDGLGGGTVVDLHGQARGALALWFATRGADAGATADLTGVEPAPSAEELDQGIDPSSRPWPDPCDAGPAPVVWGVSDVQAARALTELPDEVVHGAIDGDWERFTDPATTTDELLVAVGLEPIGRSSARTFPGGC